MMNHEQRIQEIMRRSKQRIRIRRRVISACVPLVLCVTVLSVWMLRGGASADSAAGDVLYSANGSAECAPAAGTKQEAALAAAEAEGRTYTDTELLRLLEELLTLPAEPMPGGYDPENGETVLILIGTDGSRTEYWLRQNRLDNREGMRILTDSQYRLLREYLEITQ